MLKNIIKAPIFIIMLISASFMLGAHGEFKKELSFPDTYTLDTESLVRNGHSLRVKRKYGMDFKVYEAALYVKEKTAEPDKLLNFTSPMFLKMEFVRKVESELIVKGWKEAHYRNCQKECDLKATKKAFRKFNKAMVDMKKGGTIDIKIMPNKVHVKVKGRVDKSDVTIEDPNFPTNLMAIFVGPKVEDKRLKKGLLGL